MFILSILLLQGICCKYFVCKNHQIGSRLKLGQKQTRFKISNNMQKENITSQRCGTAFKLKYPIKGVMTTILQKHQLYSSVIRLNMKQFKALWMHVWIKVALDFEYYSVSTSDLSGIMVLFFFKGSLLHETSGKECMTSCDRSLHFYVVFNSNTQKVSLHNLGFIKSRFLYQRTPLLSACTYVCPLPQKKKKQFQFNTFCSSFRSRHPIHLAGKLILIPLSRREG